MLEHSLDDDAIDSRCRNRNGVAVANELHVGAHIDVEGDEVDRGVVVQLVEAVADGAAPDDQNPGAAAGRRGVGVEQLEHAGHVGRRGVVGGMC